jgi:predicted TIM-barrel fold metal-dependent hydrolase
MPWTGWVKIVIIFGMDFPAYNPGPEISKVRDAEITEVQKRKIM